jgi:hypothetical protein
MSPMVVSTVKWRVNSTEVVWKLWEHSKSTTKHVARLWCQQFDSC